MRKRQIGLVVVALAVGALIAGSAEAQEPRFGIRAGWLYSDLRGGSSTPGMSLETSGNSSFSVGGFVGFHLSDRVVLMPEVLYSRRKVSVDNRMNLDMLGFPGFSSGFGHAGFGPDSLPRDLSVSSDVTISYLEVPVLVRFMLADSGTVPVLFAGPTVAFKLSASGDLRSSNYQLDSGGFFGHGPSMHDDFGFSFDPGFRNDLSDAVNSVDFGLVFGGGVEFDLGGGKLLVDARYTLGLSNVFGHGDGRFDGRFGQMGPMGPMGPQNRGFAFGNDLKHSVLAITAGYAF